VIELRDVGHRYGDGRELFSDVELLLDNRERLGIVGRTAPASRRCSTSSRGD
jgi:ATPase subunit of ABC transporter with duplicated ATPase domains